MTVPMKRAIPRSCLRDGHGPTAHRPRRVWWAPWRTRVKAECWVCETPLNPTEADAADQRWRDVP